MKRLMVLLLVLASGPAAHASWTLDLPGGLADSAVGPVFAGDGSIVFGTSGAGGLTIWRVTGDGATPQPLLTLPSGPLTQLFPAGRGFGLLRYEGGYSGSVDASYANSRLTIFPEATGPPVTVAEVPASTSLHCGRLPGEVAADAEAVLVIPTCSDLADERPAPYVYDIASGRTTTLETSWAYAPNIAGDYASGAGPYEGSVINWRTGKVARDRFRLSDGVLLDDGSVVFRDQTGVVRRRLDDTETRLPIEGYFLAAAGDGFVTFLDGYSGSTYNDRELELWDRDGAPVGVFDHVPTASATDGSRIAFLGHLCMTTRLHVWEAGAAAPPFMGPACTPPAIGRIEVGARTARVPLSCPAGSIGCVGLLRVLAPRAGVPRAFALSAGEQRTISVLSGLSRRTCVKLSLERRWRLRLDLRAEPVAQTRTLRRDRRVLCGAP